MISNLASPRNMKRGYYYRFLTSTIHFLKVPFSSISSGNSSLEQNWAIVTSICQRLSNYNYIVKPMKWDHNATTYVFINFIKYKLPNLKKKTKKPLSFNFQKCLPSHLCDCVEDSQVLVPQGPLLLRPPRHLNCDSGCILSVRSQGVKISLKHAHCLLNCSKEVVNKLWKHHN